MSTRRMQRFIEEFQFRRDDIAESREVDVMLRGALEHLRRRIALPLAPPRDWGRGNPLKCDCGDCRNLGAFLVAIPAAGGGY